MSLQGVHQTGSTPADYEVYRARADEQRALDLAATTSPFTIVVRFIAGLTQRQQEAFAAAADRWVRVIVIGASDEAT